jgi:uncharacterized membrane protein
MNTYIIIGGDGKEYGPIGADDVRQWIAEGRLNEKSLIKNEGEPEFRPLEAFLEFAPALGSVSSIPKLPPSAFAIGRPPERREDYELDIFGCFSRGFELVKNNMGLLFVSALIYVLIEGAIGALAQIPHIGVVFSIANFVISGPLMGGLFYLFILAIRGEPAEMGDLFSGFRRAFGQLFLGTLVQSLFMLLCLVPFLIVFLVKFFPLIGHFQSNSVPDKETVDALKSVLLTSLPVLLVCAIPATYLSVCWKFTLPLIVDKELDFWTAMGASRKMVNKHWWLVFGLIILISLLNVAGVFVCCVGVLFTLPVGLAALMFAYETIFSEAPPA